jgi:hypothetical protein
MPTKYKRLVHKALKTIKWRGHKMGYFIKLTYNENIPHLERITGHAICKKCGMEAYIDTRPPPNGIDISGEAVALNCGRYYNG